MPNNLSAAAIGAELGQFEPQRTNNWFIEIFLDSLVSLAASFGAGSFPNLSGLTNVDVLKLSLQSAFNPSSAKEDIQVPYLNEVIFFAGRRMVDPGSIEFIDYVDKNTQRLHDTGTTEDYGYESLKDPYKPKNNYIDSIGELKLVRGVEGPRLHVEQRLQRTARRIVRSQPREQGRVGRPGADHQVPLRQEHARGDDHAPGL